MCITGASSHMIRFVFVIKYSNGVFDFIEHVEKSSTFRGMQNLECDVLPQGINSAKIPLDAIIITISPFDLKATEIALQINVCLFPHNHKEKNTILVFIYSLS